MPELGRHEFKCCHEEWIRLSKHVLSSAISAEIKLSGDSRMPIDFCQSARNEARMALNGLLKNDGILVLPTVLWPPLNLNGKESSSEDYLNHLLCVIYRQHVRSL